MSSGIKTSAQSSSSIGESIKHITELTPPTLASQYPTTVCKFFKNGSCTKGLLCPFSHNLKDDACAFYFSKGSCRSGAACPYAHGNITLVQRMNLLRDAKAFKNSYEKKKQLEQFHNE